MNSTEEIHSEVSDDLMEYTIGITCTLIALITNAVLIYAILRNKKMWTRTSVIILTYTTSDVLEGVETMLSDSLRQFLPQYHIPCLFRDAPYTYATLNLFNTFVLVSPYVITLKELEFATLLASMWTLSGCLRVISVTMCLQSVAIPVDIIYVMLYSCGALIIIWMFVRKWKSQDMRYAIAVGYVLVVFPGALRATGCSLLDGWMDKYADTFVEFCEWLFPIGLGVYLCVAQKGFRGAFFETCCCKKMWREYDIEPMHLNESEVSVGINYSKNNQDIVH